MTLVHVKYSPCAVHPIPFLALFDLLLGGNNLEKVRENSL